MTAKEAGVPVVTKIDDIPATGPAILRTEIEQTSSRRQKPERRFRAYRDGLPAWEISCWLNIPGFKPEARIADSYNTEEPCFALNGHRANIVFAATPEDAVAVYLVWLPCGRITIENEMGAWIVRCGDGFELLSFTDSWMETGGPLDVHQMKVLKSILRHLDGFMERDKYSSLRRLLIPEEWSR